MTVSNSRRNALNKLKKVSRKRGRRKPPSRRAAKRAAVRKARPMPKPRTRPARRRPAAAAKLTEEMRSQLQSINSHFDRLEIKAQLADVYTAIGDFDAKLMALPIALEKLRGRGYVHNEQLEDRLEAIDDQWDDARPRVEEALEKHLKQLDREADRVERQVDRGATSASGIERMQTAVDRLETHINSAASSITALYDGISRELQSVKWDMNKTAEMLDLIDNSQDVRLHETEGPLLAIKTEWHRDGDEGPEGVLFLTDQRILFEQREEIVLKKRFGLFKSDSKMVQELLLDIPVQEIDEVSHKEEGGFMGMGKKDILEIIFSAAAPVARGRFHLKGQDSSDWATMIKLVQTGEIDNDRADEYEDELEETDTVTFPTQCPGCFAPVEPPARGVTNVTCEFCGTIITPEK